MGGQNVIREATAARGARPESVSSLRTNRECENNSKGKRLDGKLRSKIRETNKER